MRNYEGTTNLQGIGEVEGIKAINLQVGDMQVFNFGSLEKIENIETTKTGKTIIVTYKRFNKFAKLVDGQWIGEYEDFIRKFRATSIVVVKELNPVQEIEKEVIIENNEVSEVKEEINNAESNLTLEKLLVNSLGLKIRKSTNSDKIRKLDINLECDLAYIRCKFKRMLKNINSINLYNSTNKIYTIKKELFIDNCRQVKEKDYLIKMLKKIIIDFQNKNLSVSYIKFEGVINDDKNFINCN